MRTLVFGFSAVAVALLASACSSAPQSSNDDSDQALEADRHHATLDAGTDAGHATDAGAGNGGNGDGDGTPVRDACTSKLGDGLSGSFGRLDGYIVAIVPPGGSRSCYADSTHVHLQVMADNEVYDIAVNVDGGFLDEFDHALVGGAWSEGWHANESLDYVSSLGIHTAGFMAGSQSTIETEVEAALAQANHVSIFATTYNKSGAHLVHRQGKNNDGAIFIDPLSASPHVLAFHFSTQSF